MGHSRLLITALLGLALAACSSATTQELRADPREKGTVSVRQPYPVVYSNLSNRAAYCFHGGTPASNFRTEATEVEPGKYGTVEVIHAGILVSEVLISADVRATADGTEVTYFVNSRIYPIFSDAKDRFRPIMEEWAAGTGTRCLA